MKRGAAPYRNKTPRRLSERILKHHHQLLTFLKQPGLASDNHQAERLIRPYVIIRKRSYQSRSPSGAAIRSALMSWVQTLALQVKTIGPTLGGAYARHRQGDPTPPAAGRLSRRLTGAKQIPLKIFVDELADPIETLEPQRQGPGLGGG